MNKIVSVLLSDILFDPEEAGETLTNCLRRRRHMRLVGACCTDRTLIVMFEETPRPCGSKLVLAPFRGRDSSEITEEMTDRYEHDYLPRASFTAGGKLWALFEAPEAAKP